VKTLIKLAIVALLANALWRLGTTYSSYYRFKDSVYSAALQQGRSDDNLREKVAELATTYDVPLKAENVTIRREEEHHVVIEGSYKKAIALLPGYEYAWPFSVSVDAYIIAPPRLNELPRP
jgi:hypothetical protein